MNDLHSISSRARTAFADLSVSAVDQRNRTLLRIAELLSEQEENIFSANSEDLRMAEAEGLAAPLLHRLKFGREKIDQVIS